ncbi:MAG: acetamidase/formamidase family protein [Acetobacteraceae bacterium]
MAEHHLLPTPATVRWGTFDAAYLPVLTVASGDSIVIETVSGGPEVMPPPGSGLAVPPRLAAIHEAGLPRVGGHILTGPVAVADAAPGDMLEVRIEKIEFGTDWGYCGFRPLAGTLPEDFPERYLSHIPIDRARRVCRLPWGTDLPLAPFFGVMGTAPPPDWGTISTVEPRAHGGNLDNKELGAGATLYLPVFVPGANFSTGDGHGVQGDGEVCINALETSLIGTFRLTLHSGGGARDPILRYPRAETATHFISMGMHEDLDIAMKTALREMIAFITGRTNLSRQQAYQLCSLAVDFHVTQTVNREKGVHGLLPKQLLS